MSILATAGAAGLSAASGLIQSSQNRKNVKDTIAAQKSMQEYEWQQNLDLYHYNNAYNTPQQQMERLSEAGLNPNLVYGSGSVAGNTSGALPKYDASKPDYSGRSSNTGEFLQNLSTYLDFFTKTAQINNLEEQNKMIQAQTQSVQLGNDRSAWDLDIDRNGKVIRSVTAPDGSTSSSEGEPWYEISRQAGYQSNLHRSQIDEKNNFILGGTMMNTIEKARLEVENLLKTGRNIDAQTQQRITQTIGQQLENELRQLGITSSDNILFRVLGRLINQFFPSFKF